MEDHIPSKSVPNPVRFVYAVGLVVAGILLSLAYGVGEKPFPRPDQFVRGKVLAEPSAEVFNDRLVVMPVYMDGVGYRLAFIATEENLSAGMYVECNETDDREMMEQPLPKGMPRAVVCVSSAR